MSPRDRMLVIVVWFTLALMTIGNRYPATRGPLVVAGCLVVLLHLVSVHAGEFRSLRGDPGPPFERAMRRPERSPNRPEDLARLERALGWGVYEPADFEVRVRPLLRSLIAGRLADRRGIDLERQPGEAARALGPELWEIARPSGETSVGANVDTAYISALVSRIEEL